MANPLPLIGLPSQDAIWSATITSMTNEDTAFPRTRIKEGNPARVAKATDDNTDIVITTSTSIIPAAIFLFNTNAETASINGSPITIPSLHSDGQRVHPWMDMRGSPAASGTTWTLSLARSSGLVWIGRVCLVIDLHELPVKHGTLKEGRLRPGDGLIETRLGSEIKNRQQIRRRTYEGVVDVIEAQPILSELEFGSEGINFPFPLVPDENTNDALFVTSRIDYSQSIPNYDVREIPISFIEVSNGPPNG